MTAAERTEGDLLLDLPRHTQTIMLATMWLGLVAAAAGVMNGRSAVAGENEITVAAASDLNFAFKEMVSAFEKQTGTRVKLSLGSSGNFFSQITNGAPFDLYFSADIAYPRRLVDAGLAVPGSLYQYAVGRIVVWVPRDSALDVVQGMNVLLDPRIRKIAMANPAHAPYGRAAQAALRHYRLYDKVAEKLVLGENISQTAQFVQSGSADVGLVALSLALAPGMKDAGRFWQIPAEAHPPLVQGAVILARSSRQAAAGQFLTFLQGPQGTGIMRRYGFMVPQ